MTPLLLHRFGVCTALALATLVSACAVLSPPPSPEPLLQDALFGHPLRPAGADEVFVVNAAMRAPGACRDGPCRPRRRPAGGAGRIARCAGDLRLDYDASLTRNAAEAYDARAGNCLSLVVMTAALAREMGLEVGFQSTRSGDVVSRESDLMLRSGHVNLLLGTHRPAGQVRRHDAQPGQRALAGRLPAARGPARRAAGDHRRAAGTGHVHEQPAVETLLAQRPIEAYAWAREALRRDSGFWAAYNTLGVVYQRSGHLGAAAAVFEHALTHDPRNVAAMGNLEQVLQAQGREAEAAHWAQRRLALEPYPPFHFLRQGQAAMARQDYPQARRLFDRELASSGPSHELHFWLAQVNFALGDTQAAQQAMRRAMDWSATPVQQARYAAKLAALKALAMP